jgi:hypothetical protein
MGKRNRDGGGRCARAYSITRKKYSADPRRAKPMTKMHLADI